MTSKGRLLGIGFAVFAVICLVATYDYSKGRIPQTASRLVQDVLVEGNARECARDVTAAVTRHIPVGTDRGEAERILAGAVITPPAAWFWKPQIENGTLAESASLEAIRTIRTTPFVANLLRVYLGFEDGKVKRVAAEVICHFG